MIPALALLAALLAPPSLTARWDGPGRATITWSGAGCVYRNATLIACDLRDVGHQIVLGEGLTDGALRPEAGDVYTLARFDGSIEKTRLVCRVYFAVWLG